MMEIIDRVISRIEAPDDRARKAAQERQDRLTKPRGSLGYLETLSVRIAGICGRPNPRIGKGAVFVMAADHGVCAEGISAYPQEVTPQMVMSFVSGGAAINAIAAASACRVVVADVGVASELPAGASIHRRKVALGTQNLARGPAMTLAQAEESVAAGMEIFEAELAREGFDIAATGDMGIGNTTSACAVASVLLRKDPSELAGRGTGIDDETLSRKVGLIRRAIALHAPRADDPWGTLTALGGFEIGALAGVILASAARRIPLVVDGYISGAAALLAKALCPASAEYMIAGHLSADSGHGAMLADLGLEPLLNLGMRLGEGTGAALAIPLCRTACRVLNDMATFESAGVSEK
ncbi:MAG: nicotinate-nucleotide--dimethylbenzimidazole phosphoribosyltransferase [Spirochaetes bacterium]|nr:MAG: nicotinate-nucleotide--dimethylbenzimidazole phosphoribosyltransferase [Spirochaetota bacterium]